MNLIKMSIQQPITIAVGVILAVLAGVMAFLQVPIQMTPEVDSVVISVTTTWENASAAEIESDVIEQQEEKLSDLSGLVTMTSISQPGSGQIRLEFRTGTDIKRALAEVDQKLSEVPVYPDGVDEPEVEDVDPESRDYIAWIGLSATDPAFDVTTLYDFMERRLRPRFERLPGIAQVGIFGAREREVHIRVNPVALAQRGITYSALVQAIQLSNDNYSGGKLPDGKYDIRIRSVGRFRDVEWVRNMVIRRDAVGPVYLRDVADVVETHKERRDWVRARGQLSSAFNFQLERGGNLLQTMAAIKREVHALNAPGGLLDLEAQRLGLNGTLELVQVYDATTYVNDAIALVQSNVIVGGLLATMTLLLFLRSLRTIGIIALAIPISVIASVVVLVAMGRSMNIISLAGIAFATGMVVDNAIVVIENIFRHVGMGKPVRTATLDGTQEVAGAVVASTLTTLVVFIPILLIEESAGQLFRDIALAIMAAVGLSMIVALSVIPSAAARLLKPQQRTSPSAVRAASSRFRRSLTSLFRVLQRAADLPALIGGIVSRIMGSWVTRIALMTVMALVTIIGTWWLLPPLDYLPKGNRNVVFGMLIPPPGYNIDQLFEIGTRMEERVRPAWEIAGDRFQIEPIKRGGPPSSDDRRIPLPVGDGSGLMVTPPPLEHYFLVAWDGRVFQVAISADKKRVVDAIPLMNHAASAETAPDVFSFAFQFPLFRTGGTTGSAIKVDLVGDDLNRVAPAAAALFGQLLGLFGPASVTPEPANFLLGTPELRFTPDDERLRDVGMTRRDVGLAVQANSDGIVLARSYELGGELKDLKILTPAALDNRPIDALLQSPLATPDGRIVDLQSLGSLQRLREPDQIKHADRQRAVTLQVTPPPGLPLEQAIAGIRTAVAGLKTQGAISPDVEVNLAGSAGKLNEIKTALLGDGSAVGLITSSLFLALLVVYLLMVVLFQSWMYPLVIMVSVPLATFGGFVGLALVHYWSVSDRYMPVQNLDVLTILGFVILAGTVVNNAILIVHQTLNFLRGESEDGENVSHLTPKQAIAQSVSSRVRPILMSTLTSVGGMLPLVLMPGSGSELYRGLGAVVVGGLVVSTVFTLFLVPVILSVVFDLRPPRLREAPEALAVAVDVGDLQMDKIDIKTLKQAYERE
jgi:hydrophobic/amphiphilic exporter-1 (mainly G- bacteria), HAE1 family